MNMRKYNMMKERKPETSIVSPIEILQLFYTNKKIRFNSLNFNLLNRIIMW